MGIKNWSRNGYKNTVRLLDHGADNHFYNDYALRIVPENGDTNIVELLLNRGADIHCCNDSALRLAARNGHTNTVELLLNCGANIHCLNDTFGIAL